jgi:hypothetical protein
MLLLIVFKNLSTRGQFGVNMKISVLKMGVLYKGAKTRIGCFLGNGCNDFD